MSDEDLRTRILLAGAKGELEEEAANAMLEVLSGAPLLREVPSEGDRALGRKEIYQTLDSEGNLLMAGRNYMLMEKKVKVLREERGAGNILDVYMRVYYLNADLEEKFYVVDGRYPKGVFGGAVFNSPFKSIK